MAYDNLLCPHCRCQLNPPVGSVSQIVCPRCNIWLDIESSCSGSCLSCHALPKSKQTGSCTDVSDKEIPEVKVDSRALYKDKAKHTNAKAPWLQAFLSRFFLYDDN